ncbi:unnamed protein product, partial [Mesorhabditis belari]|uniref:Serpentine Receptor, class H n=1 Tax=Mesorhabditis belari TaxID=2138241 RepID=A0AAF3ECW3_9BILA
MKDFKWILLKLALMEELFSTFMGGILFPDCLFPAQGAVVLGLASYFGPIGGQFAVAGTFFFGMSIFVSINDCVHVRSLVFHGKHQLVEALVKPQIGIPLTLAIKGIIAAPMFFTMWMGFENSENFVSRMKALAKWEYIEYYAMDNGTVWVSMDVAQTWTIVFLMVVVFGLIAIYMANLLSALILYRQLRSLQSHMSAVSFKTHISVLYMLITQNIYPLIIMVLPVIYTGIGFVTNNSAMLASNLYKNVAVLGLILYPTISCLISIVMMKPYREFVKTKIFKKIHRQRIVAATTSNLNSNLRRTNAFSQTQLTTRTLSTSNHPTSRND